MVATLKTTSLTSPVLVLNKGWLAIDATTAREAITDVMAEKAQVVHPRSFTLHNMEEWMSQKINENDLFIQAARQRILVPEVVVNHYEKVPHRTVVFSRRNLWKRDRYRCQYCGKRPSHDEVSVDHVVPKAIWNRQNHSKSVTCFENCVLACVECNKKKDNFNNGNKTKGIHLREGLDHQKHIL